MKRKNTSSYRIFTRTWWIVNRSGEWPNNLEPCAGRKTTIGIAYTIEEAQDICAKWNASHKPGLLSRMAEFEDR